MYGQHTFDLMDLEEGGERGGEGGKEKGRVVWVDLGGVGGGSRNMIQNTLHEILKKNLITKICNKMKLGLERWHSTSEPYKLFQKLKFGSQYPLQGSLPPPVTSAPRDLTYPLLAPRAHTHTCHTHTHTFLNANK